MSANTLTVPIGFSRRLRSLSLLSGVFAMLCWQWVNLPTLVLALGSVVIAALMLWLHRNLQTTSLLSFDSHRGWQLVRHGGEPLPVELLDPSLVSPWVIAMRFKHESGNIKLCLLRDAVPAELHRKLRVLLNTGHHRSSREQ